MVFNISQFHSIFYKLICNLSEQKKLSKTLKQSSRLQSFCTKMYIWTIGYKPVIWGQCRNKVITTSSLATRDHQIRWKKPSGRKHDILAGITVGLHGVWLMRHSKFGQHVKSVISATQLKPFKDLNPFKNSTDWWKLNIWDYKGRLSKSQKKDDKWKLKLTSILRKIFFFLSIRTGGLNEL